MARSLTGVGGVARRHRARRNTGDPSSRGVASLASACSEKRRWVSEGRTVPHGPAGHHNRRGGEGPPVGGGVAATKGGGVGGARGTPPSAPDTPRGAAPK